MVDSDSDYASDHSDIKSYCRCIFNHDAVNSDELELVVGDIIRVIDNGDDDWWWGESNEKEGWFSTAFIEMVNIEEPLEYYGEVAKTKQGITQRIYSDNYRRKKAKILDEFLVNETEYVMNLCHIVDGYYQKSLASGLFSPEQIDKIFGNIVDIAEFHQIFLRKLKRLVCTYSIEQISQLFQKNLGKFNMYKRYCTNFTESTDYLNSLLQYKDYREFFNKCRCNDEQVIRLPLSSYLLGPVQRICKYPLQLEALLQVAENESVESGVKSIHKQMKRLLEDINDHKKKSETYMEIDVWKQKIDNWTGPNLHNSSSELIHYSEVVLYEEHKRESLLMYLFDNQLILCAKLSDARLVYRHRFDLCDLTVKYERRIFHITYEIRELKGETQLFQIYVKNRRQRQQWHYLLQLEIGFSKIKKNYARNVELHNEGKIRLDESTMTNEICQFIRQCNRQLKIHLKHNNRR